MDYKIWGAAVLLLLFIVGGPLLFTQADSNNTSNPEPEIIEIAEITVDEISEDCSTEEKVRDGELREVEECNIVVDFTVDSDDVLDSERLDFLATKKTAFGSTKWRGNVELTCDEEFNLEEFDQRTLIKQSGNYCLSNR